MRRIPRSRRDLISAQVAALSPLAVVVALAARRRAVAAVARLGEPAAEDGVPRLLAGDFNATLDHVLAPPGRRSAA